MIDIDTGRLLLRAWRLSDAEDLLEFGGDKSVKQAGWEPLQSLNDCEHFIQSAIDAADSRAVVLKETGKVIGWILLGDTGRYDLYKELEFVISEKFRNRGYAAEAVKGMLRYAFETLGVLVVTVCHYPDNAPSKRVIEKCGFTYEGTLRKYSRNLSDSVRYSMLKEEWENQK